nr:hypothetical protein [Tanacetum cinerariifolium]
QKGRDNKPKPQANKKVKGKGKADKNKQFVLQGFKEERKLSYGVQYLQVGNGTQAAVEAI